MNGDWCPRPIGPIDDRGQQRERLSRLWQRAPRLLRSCWMPSGDGVSSISGNVPPVTSLGRASKDDGSTAAPGLPEAPAPSDSAGSDRVPSNGEGCCPPRVT